MSQKETESGQKSDHAKTLSSSKTQTCFGLAEEILNGLKKGEYESYNLPYLENNKPENLPGFIVKSIHIPRDKRGDEKLSATAGVVNYLISSQLLQAGKKPAQIGVAHINGDAYFWIESFDPKAISFDSAKREINSLKKIFKEVPDPFFASPRSGKRADGSYWIGPFGDNENHITGLFLNALTKFHGVTLSARNMGLVNDNTAVERNNAQPETDETKAQNQSFAECKERYYDCDRSQMRTLLQKEGLIEKSRGT